VVITSPVEINMPIVKIQHADPANGHPVAFDILGADDMDTVRESFVLETGHFKLIELAGGLVLREVSMATLRERETKAAEEQASANEPAAEEPASVIESDNTGTAQTTAEQAPPEHHDEHEAADDTIVH
jgi:hypothetical protein